MQHVSTNEIKIRKEYNIRSNKKLSKSFINSIRRSGIRQPILLNKNMELVAGERRLLAAIQLKMTTVPAIMHAFLNEEDERIAHIDENLERENLKGAELDKAISERKKIYEGLKPQSTARGPAKARALKATPEQAKAFVVDTSEKTGMSQRSVQQSVKRVNGADATVLDLYEKKDLKKKQVDLLVKLPVAEQKKLAPKCVGMSVAETDDVVRKAQGRTKKPKQTPKVTPIQKPADMAVDFGSSLEVQGGKIKSFIATKIMEGMTKAELEMLAETSRGFVAQVQALVGELNTQRKAKG